MESGKDIVEQGRSNARLATWTWEAGSFFEPYLPFNIPTSILFKLYYLAGSNV